uniref:Uncharacterized protein n=1 Tax=Anguilla anguilla TaxID=7936 RepID=A0A0E9PCT0_ANGAN
MMMMIIIMKRQPFPLLTPCCDS